MELTVEIKNTIINFPNLSNREIAQKLNCSSKKVSAIRIWSNKEKTTTRKNTNGVYSNGEGVCKQQAREKIINCITETGLRKGKVLSLPFKTCELELQINRTIHNRFNYIACERSEDYYYEMLETIAKQRLNMNTYLGEIKDKIYEAKENEYTHLILDYCGQLSSAQEEIKHAIKNNIVSVGGIIAVTLCKRGSLTGKIGAKMEGLPSNYFGDEIGEENKHITAARLYFADFIGTNYVMPVFFEYQDDGKAPMMLIILKRIA